MDSDLIFAKVDFEAWRNVIDWCAELGVQLVNSEGDRIHLWRIRHGIRFDTKDMGYGTGDEDDSWYEGDEPPTQSIDESDSESQASGDDSQDGHYRYVYRPDIEQIHPDVDPDSDEEVQSPVLFMG